MSYDEFAQGYDAGRLTAFVDRMRGVQAYRLSGSPLATVLPLVFLGGLLAFIPVMIFVGFWKGVLVLVVAVMARKMLTKVAVDWVRK